MSKRVEFDLFQSEETFKEHSPQNRPSSENSWGKYGIAGYNAELEVVNAVQKLLTDDETSGMGLSAILKKVANDQPKMGCEDCPHCDYCIKPFTEEQIFKSWNAKYGSRLYPLPENSITPVSAQRNNEERGNSLDGNANQNQKTLPPTAYQFHGILESKTNVVYRGPVDQNSLTFNPPLGPLYQPLSSPQFPRNGPPGLINPSSMQRQEVLDLLGHHVSERELMMAINLCDMNTTETAQFLMQYRKEVLQWRLMGLDMATKEMRAARARFAAGRGTARRAPLPGLGADAGSASVGLGISLQRMNLRVENNLPPTQASQEMQNMLRATLSIVPNSAQGQDPQVSRINPTLFPEMTGFGPLFPAFNGAGPAGQPWLPGHRASDSGPPGLGYDSAFPPLPNGPPTGPQFPHNRRRIRGTRSTHLRSAANAGLPVNSLGIPISPPPGITTRPNPQGSAAFPPGPAIPFAPTRNNRRGHGKSRFPFN
jgi:hypothetical protein